MNDRTKKIILSLVCILALVAAIYEGKTALSDPELIKSREMGHGTPGHGIKATEMAEEAKAAAAMKAGKPADSPPGGDDIAATPDKPKG